MRMRAISATLLFALTLSAAACGSSPTAPPPPPPPVDEEPPPPPPPPDPVPTFAITKILAFGDSLTEGESKGQLFRGLTDHSLPGIATSYPFKLQALLASIYTDQTFKVFNGGVGGERADRSATRDRLMQEIRDYKPQAVLIMHGANDLIGAIIDDTDIGPAVNGVEELVELARGNGLPVFLASLPPEKDTSKAKGFALVDDFNEVLVDVAREEGATFVDIHAVINRNTMLMPDGLHVTPDGNQKIAETFYAALKAKYHKAPTAMR